MEYTNQGKQNKKQYLQFQRKGNAIGMQMA